MLHIPQENRCKVAPVIINRCNDLYTLYISSLVARTAHVPEAGVATNLTLLELISTLNTSGFVSPVSSVDVSVNATISPIFSHAATTSLVLWFVPLRTFTNHFAAYPSPSENESTTVSEEILVVSSVIIDAGTLPPVLIINSCAVTEWSTYIEPVTDTLPVNSCLSEISSPNLLLPDA